MNCSFCGLEFDPAEGQVACSGCPLVSDCGLVRCPRCGYEMLPEAWLVRWLRERRRSRPQAAGIVEKETR